MARTDRLSVEIYQPDMVLYMNIIEMASLSLLLICVIMYIKILRKRQFCHPNLFILLLSQPIVHISSSFTRLLRHLLTWSGLITQTWIDLINFISDSCISTTFVIVLAYSIERIIAMKYVDTYENMWIKRPTLGIGLVTGALIYSGFLIKLWYLEWLPNLPTYGAQYILFTLATIFFITLRRVSMRAYRVVADTKESTVHQRYLTARNLKAAKLLIRLAPYKCMTNYISLGVYYWIFEYHTPYQLPFYSCIYFYLSHIQLYIQMLLTIFGHSVLKEETYRLFGFKGTSAEPESITNVLGNKMIFSAEEGNEVYFKQMNAMWATIGPIEDMRKKKYTVETS